MNKFGKKNTEGNYLGKSRCNFYLTNRSRDLLHALSLEFGLQHSPMLELCIREKYIRDIGPVPKIQYLNGEKPD